MNDHGLNDLDIFDDLETVEDQNEDALASPLGNSYSDDDDNKSTNEPDVVQGPTNGEEGDDNHDNNPDDDEQGGNKQVESTTDNDSVEESELIKSLLKEKGIDDLSKIKFENDKGEIEEISWKDLSNEEKMAILSPEQEDDNTRLDEQEINLINQMRLHNITPQEFVQIIKQQGVAEYVAQQENPDAHYAVDDLTDEELYLLDLQARVEGITEEELQEALDRAKSNEELFQKEITGIRNEYKKLEEDKNQRDAALEEQKAQEQFAQFSRDIVNSIENFTNVGELDVDMDDNDMNELYQFITGSNNAGVRYLDQALSDPNTLVRMAWFALKGEDIINSISDYYKSEITKAHRAGVEEGKKKAAPKEQKVKEESKVVVKKKEPENREKARIDISDIW